MNGDPAYWVKFLANICPVKATTEWSGKNNPSVYETSQIWVKMNH